MQFQLLALAAAAAIANAQSIQFPAVCQAQCTPFGNALMGSCMTTPTSTDVSVTALKIAVCFCNQYGAGGGVACATCVGNEPTLVGKNSTVLFTSLVASCVSDTTSAGAAKLIEPIIHDAVLQNVAVATVTGTGKSGATVTATKTGAAGSNIVSIAAIAVAVLATL
ncbi:UNVERIFIED_CONTAM: hypothetical protein HDU68_003255 [Siphonaria sp. JEL0065]|nr:hypothetical protein HDU68_003255 [Siphonaria sp. JEL0065]